MRLKSWWAEDPDKLVHSSRMGDVVRADALQALRAIADQSADVVFLDPPFNLGKDYGGKGAASDRMSDRQYQKYINDVLSESARILKTGGALFLYHLPRWAIKFAAELDELLSFRNWIAVSMKNGFVRGNRLYPAHYALLYYTKGRPAVARRPKIAPSTCPHCGEFVKDYGGYASHVKDGINLSDVWDDFSPVRHSKYKNRAANELPVGLVLRALDISGVPAGLLVDPFAGTGTAAVAARLRKMKFIAIDREASNCTVIAERLKRVSTRQRRSPDVPS